PVWKGMCLDMDFRLRTDGRISGTVTRADGKPASYIQVEILPVSPAGEVPTTITDGLGHFEVGGRQPGSYVVGVGISAIVGTLEWQSRVYYPGVSSREQANLVVLGERDWRTDIDFKLPQDSAKR